MSSRFYEALLQIIGFAWILFGAATWAGLAYTSSMEAVVNFVIGFFLIAIGTAFQLFRVED